MNYLLPIQLTILLIYTCFCEEFVKVSLNEGELLGRVENTWLKNEKYFAFKGIPYALPPLNELRFKPPIRQQAWNNNYEAYDDKPTCFQYNARERNGETYGMSGSEDCLYLSVYTPQIEGTAPVIVFDYNDNFKSGFNGSKNYSPDFFLEENVVVVTISHRLGLFGYLSTEDEKIPANNGLKDFILGLKWVKENIKQFGGDPGRVTLMGSRGGAVLIDILLHSEKSKDLFSAVILQSGTALEPIFFYEKSREIAFKLGKQFDIETDNSETLLRELQKIDAELLVSKEGNVIDTEDFELSQLSIYPFAPVIETPSPDAIITNLPEYGSVINDVPVIIGMNSREGLDLAIDYIFEPRLLMETSENLFMHFPIRSGFRLDRNGSVYEDMVKELKNFYFTHGFVENVLEYTVYVGDMLQHYALNLATKKLTKDLKSSVYYYMFDFRGQLNENSNYISRYARSSLENWGATITDELCYLHMCSRIKKMYNELIKLPSEQSEIKILKKMVRLWTNFAKYRNPTPSGDDDILGSFTWLPVDKGSIDTNYLHITKKLRMNKNPIDERAKFWDELLAKYSAIAVDAVVSNEKRSDL